MGGDVLPGTTPDGDGDAVVLCGFGGCPQVWNHKGPCEVPILDSRRRAPRPARLDDSPERHRPEERVDGDTSSAAARHGTSADSAPKHENENGRAVSLQAAPEPSTETRPAAEPAPEHAPAAAEPRLDTQPPPEHAPVTLDVVSDDSQRPTPAPTPLPTPTTLGLPSPRPTGEAACVRGEETPAPTLVPSISPQGAVPSVSPPESLTHREELSPPLEMPEEEEIVTEVMVDGVLIQLYLSRQSSTGYRGVVDCSRPGQQERDRPYKAQATAPQVRPLGYFA